MAENQQLIQLYSFSLFRVLGSTKSSRKAYLAYISEGMGKLQDWEMVMEYQMKNGSLFNSPAATAAALSHLQNVGCLNYLRSLLEKFGNAGTDLPLCFSVAFCVFKFLPLTCISFLLLISPVPTVYPLDIYARLCLVDNLEGLGIDRPFRTEIRSVLDEIYRYFK